MSDVTGILKRLAPYIEEKVRAEVYLHIDLPKDAANLVNTLKEVQMVLEEAERRRLTDPRVRAWLEKLGSVTCDIDDALDEFEIANLELRMEHENDNDDDDPKTWLQQVANFYQSFCSCLCFRHVLKRREIALTIRALNNRVDDLAKEKVKYDMLPISSEFSGDDFTKTEINTAFAEFVEVEEQEKLKQSLIETLKSEYIGSDGSVPVFSLVGMPGIGKTTIARQVYFDENFQKNFDRKMWICVSNCFDEIRVAKTILELAEVLIFPSFPDFQALLEQIKSFVSGKKLFLVFDDVWIKEPQKWKQIRASLNFAASGSGILVTTRNKNVARVMGSFGNQFEEVKGISENDCRLILTRIAFIDRKNDDELEDMIRSLAKRCGGLPLAARTLGNHLQSVYRNGLIRELLENDLWELEEVAKPIFASFSFSYYAMPSELRRCFTICGTLPKDDLVKGRMGVSSLVAFWGIQGYLSSSVTESESNDNFKKMKMKGKEYVDKLGSCFLLQSNSRNIKMHGLLHDFARYLVKTSGNKEEGRTFFSTSNIHSGGVVPQKSARVLSITGDKVTELREDIGNLIHLRLINFKDTSITRLPKSMCNLYNLQNLDLRCCKNLCQLPEGFSRLRNLRRLSLAGANSTLDKTGIEKLTKLQSFGGVYQVNSGKDLGRLKRLNQLEKHLTIRIEAELNGDEDVKEARNARLENKKLLIELNLSFGSEMSVFVADALQPPPNLKILILVMHNDSARFPTWINSSSLSKLKYLTVNYCKSCTSLPHLGTLPWLEKLELISLDSLESVGTDFLGLAAEVSIDNSGVQTATPRGTLFPRLTLLVIKDCKNLHVWDDITEEEAEMQLSIMPCLEWLDLSNCPKLKELPHRLLGIMFRLTVLNLKKTSIAELPKSICYLYNLQSLNLADCENLCKFPKRLYKLNLKELFLEGANSNLDKRGIEKLTGLLTLGTEYLVNSGKDLGRLKFLNSLEGHLRIDIKGVLDTDEDVKEARNAGLEKKVHITTLEINYGEEVSMFVADALQPPPNLNMLRLESYVGTRFPIWINSLSLSKLTVLQFRCMQCTSLPPLGTLPLLVKLGLYGIESLESIGTGFLGLVTEVSKEKSQAQIPPQERILFPRLKSLLIEICSDLQVWNDISQEEAVQFSIMPCMEYLSISTCPKLKGLPHRLLGKAASLSTLDINYSPYLAERYRRLPDASANDYSVVAHISDLIIS